MERQDSFHREQNNQAGETMEENVIIHENTYKKRDMASFLHNARLQVIHNVFQNHVSTSEITWADFGCSNGFVPEEIVKTNKYKFSKIVGYDHVEGLLELARAKKIPNAEFKRFDMNEVVNPGERFDLVTCFETLEHVGDQKNAVTNLFNHVAENGILFMTVPNETGLSGLVKFLGRLALRRDPYEDFFENQSQFDYMKSLLKNDFIDGYRKPGEAGYGPHLGFDYRKVEDYAQEKFVKSGQLKLAEKSFTRFKMNVVYVYKKVTDEKSV